MGLFNRKQKLELPTVVKEIKTPCELGHHLYRDFPPTLRWGYFSNKYSIKMIETYVCVMCGKRVDKEIAYTAWEGRAPTQDEVNEKIAEYKKDYKDLLEKPGVVEDMIQDAILVDRERLKYWDSIHIPSDNSEETEEQKLARYKVELFSKKGEMIK